MPPKKPVPLRASLDALERKVAREVARRKAAEKALAESTAREAATSEILGLISASPSDARPVFDTIAARAAKLCDASFANMVGYDGEFLTAITSYNVTSEVLALRQQLYPLRPTLDVGIGRAVLERVVVHVPDVTVLPAETALSKTRAAHGLRTFLAIPMLRDGRAIGAIGLGRHEVRPFSDAEIRLVKTFADQAVIAIENVRLFTEVEARNRDLTEALEQQTATSEILRVISRSPTDEQPVFDAIVQSARRLLSGHGASLSRVVGDMLHLVALTTKTGADDEAMRRDYPRPISGHAGSNSRAVRDRASAFVVDIQTDRGIGPVTREAAMRRGFRSVLSVPMLREGEAIGAISVTRPQAGPFTDKEIALLQTFADQAVIAIENVRLFNELEARNRDLSVALEQQTATGEILRVISRSGMDVQPVFDAIAESALRLLRGWGAVVMRFDGELLYVAAIRGGVPGSDQQLREQFPRPVGRGTFSGDAILDRDVKQIADIETEDEWAELRTSARSRGWRAALVVPML